MTLSPAKRFRSEIEKAEAAGFLRANMNLHMTRRDAAGLARDRDVPVADISFADGAMRYLGVAVVEGGVSESALHCTAGADGPADAESSSEQI